MNCVGWFVLATPPDGAPFAQGSLSLFAKENPLTGHLEWMKHASLLGVVAAR